MASSRLVTARASVRAMMTRSGSVRYSEAARILSANSRAGDHLLAGDVPALLGCHLIFEMQAGHARSLVFPHGAHHVEDVAIARVGIGDERQRDAGSEMAGMGGHLRHGGEAEVGPAQVGAGGTGPGHVDRRETGGLDQPRRKAVVGAGGDDDAWGLKHAVEASWSYASVVLSGVRAFLMSLSSSAAPDPPKEQRDHHDCQPQIGDDADRHAGQGPQAGSRAPLDVARAQELAGHCAQYWTEDQSERTQKDSHHGADQRARDRPPAPAEALGT